MYLHADSPLGRLLPRPRPLSTLALVVGTLVLAAVVTAVALDALERTRTPRAVPLLWVELYGTGGTMLLIPAIAGAFAAIATQSYISSETYQLLRLTRVPRRSVVRLLVSAALQRARGLLALSAALMPALVVAMIHRTLLRAMALYPGGAMMSNRMSPLPPPRAANAAWRLSMLGWTPEFMGWALSLLPTVMLGVALGVALTLLTRSAALAATGAAFGVLVVPAALFAALIYLPLERWGDMQRGGLVVALALAPYLLTLAVMHLSRRWV